MKLSIEQANKLLSQLAAGVTVAEDEQTADKNADLESVFNNISQVVGKAIRPELEQQVKAGVEASLTAKYLGTVRSIAHRLFNIPRRELEDLSIEQLLSKCKGTIESRNTQTGAEVQTSLEAAILGYEQQLEKQKGEYEQLLAEERAKYVERDITSRCISMIEKLPRKSGDLHEQADMLRYKMQKVFEVRYNEQTGRLELYKEGRPATTENNQPLSDEDFARTWAEQAGILMRDTRHISPADVQAGQYKGFAEVSSQDDSPRSGMNAIEAWAEG